MRADRRAYDGAPPTIPHEDFGIECGDCHNDEGIEVPDVGYAPAMPHQETAGMSAISRCRQCHVFSQTDEIFAALQARGVLGVEMEIAVLYAIAALEGVSALGLLTVSDDIVRGEFMSSQQREDTFDAMIRVALAIA